MITLATLVAKAASSLVVDEPGPVGTTKPLDMLLSRIDLIAHDLPVYPARSSSVLYASELALADDSTQVNNKELDEYQIEPINEDSLVSCMSTQELETIEEGVSIRSCVGDEKEAQVSSVTSSSSKPLTTDFHYQPSPGKVEPDSPPWPQGSLDRDNRVTYGDLKGWLDDVNHIYDEEPLFRSILKLPFPSGQSSLFPDHISTSPTYGWVLDNCLTDWVKSQVMAIGDSQAVGSDGSEQHDENSKTFDQIYMPFTDPFEVLDDAQINEFFHKLYELLAPLRGLLVLAIASIGKSRDDLVIKGQRVTRSLHQSGFPASGIRTLSSHSQHYVIASKRQLANNIRT